MIVTGSLWVATPRKITRPAGPPIGADRCRATAQCHPSRTSRRHSLESGKTSIGCTWYRILSMYAHIFPIPSILSNRVWSIVDLSILWILYIPYLADLADLSYLRYMSYLSYLSHQPYLSSNRSNQTMFLSFCVRLESISLCLQPNMSYWPSNLSRP